MICWTQTLHPTYLQFDKISLGSCLNSWKGTRLGTEDPVLSMFAVLKTTPQRRSPAFLPSVWQCIFPYNTSQTTEGRSNIIFIRTWFWGSITVLYGQYTADILLAMCRYYALITVSPDKNHLSLAQLVTLVLFKQLSPSSAQGLLAQTQHYRTNCSWLQRHIPSNFTLFKMPCSVFLSALCKISVVLLIISQAHTCLSVLVICELY